MEGRIIFFEQEAPSHDALGGELGDVMCQVLMVGVDVNRGAQQE